MAPYIHVRFSERGTHVEGDNRRTFGLPVDSSAGPWGIFSSWKYQDGQLSAEVDPGGMFSLFYAETNGGIIVSPSIREIVERGADRTLDALALTVFHMIGWFIEEDTPFRSIKVLPPGGRMIWRDGSLTVMSKEQRPIEELDIDRKTAIARYAELFCAAVAACCEATQNRFVLPLSGGRDSRHILLEAARQGHLPDRCLTLDPNNGAGVNPNFELPRRLCEHFGIAHEAVASLRSRTREQIEIIEMSNYCSDEGSQNFHFVGHMQRVGLNFMDGIGGDVLSRNKTFTDPAATADLKAGKYSSAIDRYVASFDRITETTLDTRLSGLFQPATGEARDRLCQSLDRVKDTPDPHTQFLFLTRTRREIALSPIMLMGNSLGALCPYLEPNLVEFCSALPLDVTADGKFHDAVISHFYDDLGIPYEESVAGVWPPRSLRSITSEIAESTVSKLHFGLSVAVREPLNQIMMLAGRKARTASFWENYALALRSLI